MFADERDLRAEPPAVGDEPAPQAAPQRSILEIAEPFVDAAKVRPGERVLVWHDSGHDELANEIAELCGRRGTNIELYRREFERDIDQARELPLDRIAEVVNPQLLAVERADRVLLLRGPRDPEYSKTIDAPRQAAYDQAMSIAHARRTDGKVPWLLTLPPTEADARIERMPYARYYDIFIRACKQPWDLIKERQQILVERLNAAETLTLRANLHDSDPMRRTELRMSIRGMTFVNSTVDRNFPGSEVFSAPVANSIYGQLFAPGTYLYKGLRMTDIFMRVEAGRIIEALAADGDEHLQDILSRGVGARGFGEVALGTNPGLVDRLVNTLLAEKRAKSFHITPGHCYGYSEYCGQIVNVNNGNTRELTAVHWDITVPMDESCGGGEVIADEGTSMHEVLQENGLFLRPELAVLNPVE